MVNNSGRAYFNLHNRPAFLHIDPIRLTDAGDYRCRVDFKKARTVNTVISLKVIGNSHSLFPFSPSYNVSPSRNNHSGHRFSTHDSASWRSDHNGRRWERHERTGWSLQWRRRTQVVVHIERRWEHSFTRRVSSFRFSINNNFHTLFL